MQPKRLIQISHQCWNGWRWGAVKSSKLRLQPCHQSLLVEGLQWKRLYKGNGLLLRRFYCPEGKVCYSQILLSHMCRNPVMEQFHKGPVGGHFGAERTLARLKIKYYWYNMRDDVTLWCRTCTNCAAKARPRKTPHAAMGTVRVEAPMERIAVDLMGPLNETERHNWWCKTISVSGQSQMNKQRQWQKKIVSEWVCRYGAPYSLHSDRGTNFESAVF